MSFRTTYRGTDVTCDTIEELDELLAQDGVSRNRGPTAPRSEPEPTLAPPAAAARLRVPPGDLTTRAAPSVPGARRVRHEPAPAWPTRPGDVQRQWDRLRNTDRRVCATLLWAMTLSQPIPSAAVSRRLHPAASGLKGNAGLGRMIRTRCRLLGIPHALVAQSSRARWSTGPRCGEFIERVAGLTLDQVLDMMTTDDSAPAHAIEPAAPAA